MNRSRMVAGAAIAIFTALLWLGGEDVSAAWVRFVSLATLVVVWLEAAYEKWLWAVIPMGRSKQPDLRGTWTGTLTTHWVDPATGQSPPAKVCYLVVRQTASRIRAALLTAESRSDSSVAALSENGTGITLEYLFRNQPKMNVDYRSTAHRGAVALDIDSGAGRLEGHYWTDRTSRGELQFTLRRKESSATFADASALPW